MALDYLTKSILYGALWVKLSMKKEEFKKTKEVNTKYGTSLWRSIRNLWHVFFERTSFNVKDHSIYFWKDNRIGNGSLKQLLPNIYTLNQQQDSTLHEVWWNQGWNLTYRRLMQDWKMERLANFYGTLKQSKRLQEGEDIWWKWRRKGIFTVSFI